MSDDDERAFREAMHGVRPCRPARPSSCRRNRVPRRVSSVPTNGRSCAKACCRQPIRRCSTPATNCRSGGTGSAKPSCASCAAASTSSRPRSTCTALGRHAAHEALREFIARGLAHAVTLRAYHPRQGARLGPARPGSQERREPLAAAQDDVRRLRVRPAASTAAAEPSTCCWHGPRAPDNATPPASRSCRRVRPAQRRRSRAALRSRTHPHQHEPERKYVPVERPLQRADRQAQRAPLMLETLGREQPRTSGLGCERGVFQLVRSPSAGDAPRPMSGPVGCTSSRRLRSARVRHCRQHGRSCRCHRGSPRRRPATDSNAAPHARQARH